MTTDRHAPVTVPGMSAPAKRSVSINGHMTSVSLEDAFWHRLAAQAAAAGMTRAALIARIDAGRPPGVGLATAIRLFVLDRACAIGDDAAHLERPGPHG